MSATSGKFMIGIHPLKLPLKGHAANAIYEVLLGVSIEDAFEQYTSQSAQLQIIYNDRLVSSVIVIVIH